MSKEAYAYQIVSFSGISGRIGNGRIFSQTRLMIIPKNANCP